MELKPGLMCHMSWSNIAFNQTRMELKREMSHLLGESITTFNQTRMELKPLQAEQLEEISSLLIRPEWN